MERQGTATLAANNIQTVSYTTPIELEYGDYIVPIARKDTGTIRILQGSNFNIFEL